MPVLDNHMQFFQEPGIEEDDPYAASPGETRILLTAHRDLVRKIEPEEEGEISVNAPGFVSGPVPGNRSFPGIWSRGGDLKLLVGEDSTTESPQTVVNLTNYGLNSSLKAPVLFENNNNSAFSPREGSPVVLVATLVWLASFYPKKSTD